MDTNHSPIAPEAADERASSLQLPAPRGDAPAPEDTPLASGQLDRTLEDTFPPGSRKPRHDGFTPAKIGEFIQALAASGIVAHAAAEVGLSASAAYAFRNRRQGRAFAAMWDAVLIHRSRARLAGDLQARSVLGCVSVRKQDGEIVSELHYHDNRLAMALLTRLDRLAEREAPRDEHLRALSEDLEDFIDCVAEGGDAEAFVEARRPAPPLPPTPSAPREVREDEYPDLTRLARLADCRDYLDVSPLDIETADLNPAEEEDWSHEDFIRAWRSGLMPWLAMRGDDPKARPGAGLQFHFMRLAAAHANSLYGTEPRPEHGEDRAIAPDDLAPDTICDWGPDELARAWASGYIQSFPDAFWDDLAGTGWPTEEES